MNDNPTVGWEPEEPGDGADTPAGKRKWLDNAPPWVLPAVTAVPALIIGAVLGALIFGGGSKPPAPGTELASAQTRVAELEEELTQLREQGPADIEEALKEREDEFAERERKIEEQELALEAFKKQLDKRSAAQEDPVVEKDNGAWTPPADLVGPPKQVPKYTPPPGPDLPSKPTPKPSQSPAPYTPPAAPDVSAPEPQVPSGPKPWSQFRAGAYQVGKDIQPGKYRTKEAISFQMCYWSIYEGGSNKTVVIDNDLVSAGRPTVTLKAGQEFETTGCGTWVKQ